MRACPFIHVWKYCHKISFTTTMYPHDKRNGFTGKEFQRLLQGAGIHDVPITVQNPQAKAICGCMHQMVPKTLCIVTNANPPQHIGNIGNIAELVDITIATSLHAI